MLVCNHDDMTTYHHDDESHGNGEVGDGVHPHAGTDGKRKSRRCQCRHKQIQHEEKEFCSSSLKTFKKKRRGNNNNKTLKKKKNILQKY